MNIVEVKRRIEREKARIEQIEAEKVTGFNPYQKAYIDGLARSIKIIDQYIDEQIDEMIRREHDEILMETASDQ